MLDGMLNNLLDGMLHSMLGGMLGSMLVSMVGSMLVSMADSMLDSMLECMLNSIPDGMLYSMLSNMFDSMTGSIVDGMATNVDTMSVAMPVNMSDSMLDDIARWHVAACWTACIMAWLNGMLNDTLAVCLNGVLIGVVTCSTSHLVICAMAWSMA